MDHLHKITGLGIRLQGHLKIYEYENRAAYEAGTYSRILLDRRNAIHKENAAILVVNSLAGRAHASVNQMVFGNGGTMLDSTGTITFNTPNVTGPNQNLYNPVFFQMVDDSFGALSGNQMAIRHIANTVFTDMDIRCLIDATQPFGQIASDQVQPLILKRPTDAPDGSPTATTPFYFDEIGLKLDDGTLLTHVVFVPVLKTAASVLEVVYTIRLAVGTPGPEPRNMTFFLDGIEAGSGFGVMEANFRVHAIRLNDNPYFSDIHSGDIHGRRFFASLTDSPRGTLSMWVRSRDIFTMAHDLGPSLFGSSRRSAMDISGRGYVRRQPTDITRTNPIHITIPDHGLVDGQTIDFENIEGGCSEFATSLPTNNVVTVIDANTFSLPIDGTGFAAAYTGPARLAFQTFDAPEPNVLRIGFSSSDVPNDPSASQFYWNAADSEQLPLDQWINVLISWDMSGAAGEKVLQVYFNDTPLASTSDPTYRYDPDAGFNIPYTGPTWLLGQPVISPHFIITTQYAREVLRSRS